MDTDLTRKEEGMNINRDSYEVNHYMVLCSTERYTVTILSAIFLLICSVGPSYSQVTIQSINKSVDRDLQRQLSQPTRPKPSRDEEASTKFLKQAVEESAKASQLVRQGKRYKWNAQKERDLILKNAQEKANQKIQAADNEIEKKRYELEQKEKELEDKKKALDEMFKKTSQLLNKLEQITEKAKEAQKK